MYKTYIFGINFEVKYDPDPDQDSAPDTKFAKQYQILWVFLMYETKHFGIEF